MVEAQVGCRVSSCLNFPNKRVHFFVGKWERGLPKVFNGELAGSGDAPVRSSGLCGLRTKNSDSRTTGLSLSALSLLLNGREELL